MQVESGENAPEHCRKIGINSASFYKWRSKFEWALLSRRFKVQWLARRNSPIATAVDPMSTRWGSACAFHIYLTQMALFETTRTPAAFTESGAQYTHKAKPTLSVPTAGNKEWSMDFMHHDA